MSDTVKVTRDFVVRLELDIVSDSDALCYPRDTARSAAVGIQHHLYRVPAELFTIFGTDIHARVIGVQPIMIGEEFA